MDNNIYCIPSYRKLQICVQKKILLFQQFSLFNKNPCKHIHKHIHIYIIFFKFCRDEFDKTIPDIPEDTTTKPNYVAAVDVYRQSYRLLLVWRKDRDKERFLKLCRYLVSTLDLDSPKLSYVGMALNKEYVLRWISHMNELLWKCCEYIEDLKPEYASDMKSILLYLHLLVSFTSTNTWAVLKHKNMDILKSGMNQLCANLMGQLFHRGFYVTLKVCIIQPFSLLGFCRFF